MRLVVRTYNTKRTTFVRMSQSKVNHRNLRQQNEQHLTVDLSIVDINMQMNIYAVFNKLWGRNYRITIRKLGESNYLFHIPDEASRTWVFKGICGILMTV